MFAGATGAGATWQGWSGGCGATCATVTAACESWVQSRQAGGFPGASLRRIEYGSNFDGAQVHATCWIQRNGGSTYPFDLPDPTTASCPIGQFETVNNATGCTAIPVITKNAGDPDPMCPAETGGGPTTASGMPTIGDPVNVGTGNAFLSVVDFTTGGANPLVFARHYNSNGPNDTGGLGIGWRHGFDLRFRTNSTTTPTQVFINLPDGKTFKFIKSGSLWVPADADVVAKLVKNGSIWEFTDAEDTKATFNNALLARVQTITRRNGYVLTFAYSNGNLVSVTDSYSRQITFVAGFGNGGGAPLVSMTAPSGRVYAFTYDSPLGGSEGALRLVKVAYPDATPGNPADNPNVQYVYENASFPFALTGIIDENGDRIATYAYDTNPRATLTEHAGGTDRYTLAYNAGGTVTVTSPLGKQAIYTFATVKNAPKVTQIDGQASLGCPASNSSYAYDANGFLNSTTDWNGHQTTWIKDARGLPTTTTEAVGTAVQRVTTTTWDATFRVPTQIVVPGKTTTFTYDAQGRMLTRTETDTTTHTVPYTTAGRTRAWTYTYDSTGRVLTIDGPRTDVADLTSYGYTGADLTSVTDAQGHVTSITSYDARGLPLSVTDPNGVVTDLLWDDRGRLTSITVRDPVGGDAVTTLGYDAASLVTSVTQPGGPTTTFVYDDAHRLTATQNALGERTEFTLDAMGGRTADTVKAAGGTVTYSHTRAYDELGRLLRDIGAASQTWTYAYDLDGNLTGITDPLGKAWTRAYDALDRLKQVTDPLSGIAAIAYDARDNVTGVTDQRGLVTSYVVDGFDEVIQIASPDAGTAVLTRDGAGNPTQRIDGRGIVMNATYDALDRVTSETYPGDPAENVSYIYDSISGGNFGKGRLTAIVDEVGTTEYVYDRRGNIVQEKRTIPVAGTMITAYAYDLADRLTRITYPSGRIVDYARDALGRVSGVTTKADAGAAPVTVVSSLTYQPFGPLAGWTFGNGTPHVLGFDLDYRLTGINVGGSVPFRADYFTYDGRNNIVELSIAGSGIGPYTETLAYDNLARLTQSVSTVPFLGTIDYTYDAVGNRLSRTVTAGGSVTKTYAYAATSNRLLTETRPGGTRTFTYDGAGNAIQDTDSGSGNRTLGYNHAGRLTQVIGGTGSPSMKYDAQGRRVLKAGSTTTRYVYDLDGTLIAEASNGGSTLREYIQLDGLPLAVVANPGQPTVLSYVHSDQLGRPRVMTDQAANGIWSLRTGPFGELEQLTGGATNNQRFPGQYLDTETAYHDNGFRTYDPALGRYLQSDPIGLEGGLNTYGYVGGNPVNLTDPTGEFVFLAPAVPTVGGAIIDGVLFGFGIAALLFDSSGGECEDGDCDEQFVKCSLTSLSDKPGSVFGQSRCGFCREVCIRNGSWPIRAPTTTGSVRCDYWNFPNVTE